MEPKENELESKLEFFIESLRQTVIIIEDYQPKKQEILNSKL